MGDIPAGLRRHLKGEGEQLLDWRELLERFLENCSSEDSSWSMPNRRYLHQNIYLPSRREPRLERIVLAVDSSGSVDEQCLALFCSELSAILDSYDTELTVLFHDSKVHGSQTFRKQDLPLSITPVGGGGTDFRPVCSFMEEQDLIPSCLIWFSDMQCDRYPPEPPFPVLWIASGSGEADPPFGEIVYLWGKAPEAQAVPRL